MWGIFQVAVDYPVEFVAGWVVYCFLVWLFFLQNKPLMSYFTKSKTTEPDSKVRELGFRELWPSIPTIHGLLIVLTRSPYLSDRLYAIRTLKSRIESEAANSGQGRPNNALNMFLKSRGDRVVYWISNGDIMMPAQSSSQAPMISEIKKTAKKLAKKTPIDFFISQFRDGIEIQKSQNREYPLPHDELVEGRWSIPFVEQPVWESGNRLRDIQLEIPESELERNDPRRSFGSLEDLMKARGSNELMTFPWLGNPDNCTELWGTKWKRNKCTVHVNSLSIVLTEKKWATLLPSIRRQVERTGLFEKSEVLMVSIMIAFPASWDLSVTGLTIEERDVMAAQLLDAELQVEVSNPRFRLLLDSRRQFASILSNK